jgi:hypothetical protein
MSRIRYALKFALMHVPLVLKDALGNCLHARADSRILVTRYSAKRAYTFRDFLAWVAKEVPELRQRLEFHRLPCYVRDWSRYALHVSWAGDTFDLWALRSFRHAMRLCEGCRRRSIPVLNPVDCIVNTGKSRGAKLMRAAGVRTPRCSLIGDPATFWRDLAGLALPLLIREERGHGRPAILVESQSDLNRIDLTRYQQPLAAEFIDTCDPRDGLFRKYRYVAAGTTGVARHMIANNAWEVRPERRLMTDALRQEELAYVSRPDPHHDVLQRACRSLGLDVAGVDYSLDREGQVVIWEANAFPNLNYPKNPEAGHIGSAVERCFAALARLYLDRAGAPIPMKLVDMLGQTASYSSDEGVYQTQRTPRAA